MQFQAGYICDAIGKLIYDFKASLDKQSPTDQKKLDQINGLLQNVSTFDIEFPHKHDPNYSNSNPVLSVINNIITRGLPTRSPIILEELFCAVDLILPNIAEYEFNYPSIKRDISFATVFELLHIIEPGLEILKSNYGGKLGSNLEWEFINKHPFLKQILESQRDFGTINSKLQGNRTIDFCFTSPYFHRNSSQNRTERIGRIIEIDGPHHLTSEYRYYDRYRDEMAEESNYETLRIAEDIIHDDRIDFDLLINREIYQIFRNNFQRNITENLFEYSLIFIPLAVARIQKALIEYFIVHQEIFDKNEVKIAIIERDIPCGGVAIKSIEELFININAILDETNRLPLPKIELSVFENPRWVYDSRLHCKAKTNDIDYFKNTEFDIIIDHSILRRYGIYKESDYQNPNAIRIRSSHYYDNSFGKARRVYCSELLKYKPLVKRRDDGSYDPIKKYEHHINYFIQNIFRKKGYREGQLPIISRALLQKPVIGLLPTGGGKSLAYQLPVFLQPGICIVVDPIKSLMEDQVRVLKQNWIDCCDFINSNLNREEVNKKLVDFRYGETMFLFVSPERFVMDDFRNVINKIRILKFGLAFSYCVIDEVHCVSEWGHDFRSTYLMLGNNAQIFAATRNSKPISLIGLTATASFDVLADIERELQIEHNDVANAIIMIENTIRPELFFRVIDVSEESRIEILNNDLKKIGYNLSLISNEDVLKKSEEHHFNAFDKKDFVTRETRDLPEDEMEFEYHPEYLLQGDLVNMKANDFCGIVFCPVKGTKKNEIGDYFNINGVMHVYSNLSSINSKGFFFGSDGNEELNNEVQKHFEDFLSNRTNYMICTKAFGMGIDKDNIRITYHYLYSSSLESLVQEAGRSGRDKRVSLANILISKSEEYYLSFESLIKDSRNDESIHPISNTFNRKAIRKICKEIYASKEDLISAINNVVNSLRTMVHGHLEPLSIADKTQLISRLSDFVITGYSDRKIHDYFYAGAYKGIDTEISQLYSLFKSKEFIVTSRIRELAEEYNVEYSTDYRFKYWSKNNKKRLYIDTYDEDSIGYVDLTLPLKIPSTDELKRVLAFLILKNDNSEDLIHLFIDEVIKDDLNDGTLEEVFNSTQIGTFDFIITAEKLFPDLEDTIAKKIKSIKGQLDIFENYRLKINSILTNSNNFNEFKQNLKESFKWFWLDESFMEDLIDGFNEKSAYKILELIYRVQIKRSFNKSKGNFLNFLLLLEENIDKLKFTFDKNNSTERWLKLFYNRNRFYKPNNDTGRLIYRMHSIGFLKNYTIDYKQNSLYHCTFNKFNSINDYLVIIEKYFRRYLSENESQKRILLLKERLDKPSLIENILECLYFLADFSYQEIAAKRKRGTDEIESILNTSITDDLYVNNWYEQNIFLKEQIYFYFNAKYARLGFKIHGQPFSLLEDLNEQLIDKRHIMIKYIDVLKVEGTEQNNYKHLIGSCKKILRSLSETDLNNEWLLRLLKAFAMYSVNNASYISEANSELELGFENLYRDEFFHRNDFTVIEPVFKIYFDKLLTNINEENHSFKDIKLIRMKLLINMQSIGIERFVNRNQELKQEYYA